MATFPSDSIRTKDWSDEILTDSDLETQLDLLHSYFQACLNATTGHAHTGATNQGPKISPANLLIASQATGDVLYASSATAWARLPKGTASQTLRMKADATIPEWVTAADDQTVAGSVVQVVNVQTGAVATGTTALVFDDSIPQITEGDEYMTLAITPKSATNKLKIDITVHLDCGADGNLGAALFQDATAGALAAMHSRPNSSDALCISFSHYMAAGTTSATTFKVRCGSNSGTTTFNGIGAGRIFGGVMASSITITEIKV